MRISSHLIAMVEAITTDLLVLHRGRVAFTGSVAAARQRWPTATRLEEVVVAALG